MANDLVTKNYLSMDDIFAAVAADTSTMRDSGGLMFMKFDGNTGEFSYGSDGTELAEGALFAINIPSYKKGYICWVEGKVVEEIMVAVAEGGPPRKQDLPDHGPYDDDSGWSEQYSIEMRMMDDPHLNMLFPANNKSKRIAFENMMKAFARDFRKYPGCAPIIEISSTEFEAKAPNGKKKYKKHAPVFKIVDWVELDELAALVEGTPEDYDAKEEAPRVTKSEAPKRLAKPVVEEYDDEEEEAAPPPKRRAAAPVVEEDDEEEAAPPPRRRAAAPVVEDDEEDEEDVRPARGQTTAARPRRGNF